MGSVAKDASEIDFWDVLEAIGYFLLGVLAVLALILLVLVVIWAFGALLASLGAWLVAATAQYAIGALVAALVVSIEMLITGILTSAVFWVGASAYGIYTGYEKIKEAKNNPNLIRKDAAYEYGYGTAEIILSLIPFLGKFKGRTKGENSKTIPNSTKTSKSKTNYENHGGEFNDDFARMGTQQEPPMNKPYGTNKLVQEGDDIAKIKKSGKFVEESSLEKVVAKEVTNAGEMLGNFGIPKLYTYTNGGKSVFVSPHAMKHLEELATNGAKLGPDYLKLLGQTHQKALHSAIDDVLSQGAIQYRKMYYSDGNEIMFAAPRSAGELPAIIHFR